MTSFLILMILLFRPCLCTLLFDGKHGTETFFPVTCFLFSAFPCIMLSDICNMLSDAAHVVWYIDFYLILNNPSVLGSRLKQIRVGPRIYIVTSYRKRISFTGRVASRERVWRHSGSDWRGDYHIYYGFETEYNCSAWQAG